MFSLFETEITPVILHLIKNAWFLKENERILIISDYPSSNHFISEDLFFLQQVFQRNLLARTIFEIIRQHYSENVELYYMLPTFAHYKNPNDKLLKEKMEESDFVLALTQFSLSTTPFIGEYLQRKKIKFASAPLVPPDVFLPGGPLDVDFWRIEEVTENLYLLLSNSKKFRISYVTGTDITVTIDTSSSAKPKWFHESGLLDEYGKTTNIPAGEVGIVVDASFDTCTVNGKLVVFPGFQERLKEQLEFIIENNKLIEVIGGGEVGKEILQSLTPANSYVADFGIGTNPKALNPFCPTIADKLLGMLHLSFGFDKIKHFYSPIAKITVDGKEYLRSEIFGLLEEI